MVNWILFGILLVQVCAYFLKKINLDIIDLTCPPRPVLRYLLKRPPYHSVNYLCSAPAWGYSDDNTRLWYNPTFHRSVFPWVQCTQWDWSVMDISPINGRPEYVHALFYIYWCSAPANKDGFTLFQLVVASITQGFYCYRVWLLTRSKCAAALISMVRGGCFIARNMPLSNKTILKALRCSACSCSLCSIPGKTWYSVNHAAIRG